MLRVPASGGMGISRLYRMSFADWGRLVVVPACLVMLTIWALFKSKVVDAEFGARAKPGISVYFTPPPITEWLVVYYLLVLGIPGTLLFRRYKQRRFLSVRRSPLRSVSRSRFGTCRRA